MSEKRSGIHAVITNDREQLDERTCWLLALVADELTQAMQKFAAFNSPHEGKAVIEEELDELWLHVKANTGQSTGAIDEAVQIAAMALRYAYDLAEWGPASRAENGHPRGDE